MNLNEVLTHLKNVSKLVGEISSDVTLMQGNPSASHQERIQQIVKKLEYIAQFAAGFSRALVGQKIAVGAPVGVGVGAGAGGGGGLSKLDAIRFVFQSDVSLRNWYQSELGVTAQDFTDQNVNSSMAEQIINDGIGKGVIRKTGDNAFVPMKK